MFRVYATSTCPEQPSLRAAPWGSVTTTPHSSHAELRDTEKSGDLPKDPDVSRHRRGTERERESKPLKTW